MTPTWVHSIPLFASGKYWASVIERHVAPKDWRDSLRHVPVEVRVDAEAYLEQRVKLINEHRAWLRRTGRIAA